MPTEPQYEHAEERTLAHSYNAYKLSACVCAVVFTILVFVDVWKAFRRKATWIPGRALVLSALTIQLLLFIDHVDVSIHSVIKNEYLIQLEMIHLRQEQLIIDSRRVMICVFIAYLLPGIVSRELKSVWRDVGALALTVIAHMAYEAYFLWSNEYSLEYWGGLNVSAGWLIPSYIVLSLAIILLVVLLSCAVIAGQTIRNIMSQKVRSALSCCSNSPECSLCKNIEDHVLKSWIVVRASQPDYIMARSVFCAFAGVLVTVCDVLLVVIWIYLPFPAYPMHKRVYAIQCAFVVVGSMVVVFRWFTAVLYFPRDLGCFLYLEDFWTRTLVQQKQGLRRWRLFLSLSLTTLQCVQKLVVFASKVCWFLSQFVFGMIRPIIMRKNKSDQFSKYEEALETILMPGEKADSLWRANKSAFEKTENNLKKGIENGKSSCKELISLMEHKTGTPEEEPPTWLEEEMQFKAVGKNSWKMRAVSLIHLIIYFCDGANSDMVNVCIEAYLQASCFMDMVDLSDPETKLAREAADNEFNTLQDIWQKHRKMRSAENFRRAQRDEEKASNRPQSQREEAMETEDQGKASNELLKQKIRTPLEDNIKQLYQEEKSKGEKCDKYPSVDALHEDYLKTVDKIWNVVLLDSNQDDAIQTLRSNPDDAIQKLRSYPGDAINKLRCLLAHIIYHCLKDNVLDKAIRKNCNKWAEDGEENEIFNAASIAGKAQGVREQIPQSRGNAAVRVPV